MSTTTGSTKEMIRYEIGCGKYVVVTSYKNEVLTHIRHFDLSMNGSKMFPTKRGIVLRPRGFANLVQLKDDITNALVTAVADVSVKMHKHIANGVYVSVSTDYAIVNLRSYFLPENSKEPQPTRRGICLTMSEWLNFLSVIDLMCAEVKELKDATPSLCEDDHENQMSFYNCSYCNPFNIMPE